MDWKQEVLKRLDVLAEKLGTTGQYLWAILVKQAWVDGMVYAAWAAACSILAIVGMVCSVKLWKYVLNEDDDYTLGALFLTVGTVTACLCAIFNLSDALQHMINPEYYALKEVLETISGAVK